MKAAAYADPLCSSTREGSKVDGKECPYCTEIGWVRWHACTTEDSGGLLGLNLWHNLPAWATEETSWKGYPVPTAGFLTETAG